MCARQRQTSTLWSSIADSVTLLISLGPTKSSIQVSNQRLVNANRVRRLVNVCVVVAITILAVPAWAQTPGNWQLYPSQTSAYATTVQQPINVDGTSNFKANGKGVIPVQFKLSEAPGPVIFQSVGVAPTSDGNPDNDYSFLSFTPTVTLTFSELTELKANYSDFEGNCHGGSLRWSVRVSETQSVFIYYGDYPNFADCTTNSQSGTNMINRPELRYDTTQVGGTFYDSYANAVALVGNIPIIRASLVLDSGWGGDQVISSVTGMTVNGNTFVPVSGSGSPTCALPEASIRVTKIAPNATGVVNEPITVQPAHNDDLFRVVDCKYMYNLATSSLTGAGRYKVEAIIGGTAASGEAYFDLK